MTPKHLHDQQDLCVIVNVNVDEKHGETIADHDPDHVHDHEEEVAKPGSGELDTRLTQA